MENKHALRTRLNALIDRENEITPLVRNIKLAAHLLASLADLEHASPELIEVCLCIEENAVMKWDETYDAERYQSLFAEALMLAERDFFIPGTRTDAPCHFSNVVRAAMQNIIDLRYAARSYMIAHEAIAADIAASTKTA